MRRRTTGKPERAGSGIEIPWIFSGLCSLGAVGIQSWPGWGRPGGRAPKIARPASLDDNSILARPARSRRRESPYLPVAFCLDLPPTHRYYPPTLRQAVSFQGSERITPSLAGFLGKLMRAPTSTNVAQTLSIKAGTAKRFSVSREIAGLSSGTRPRSTPLANREVLCDGEALPARRRVVGALSFCADVSREERLRSGRVTVDLRSCKASFRI
jgi:hypothetical protein